MKRTILVTWTCSEEIELDIPDGEKTAEEIWSMANEAAQEILPDCPDEWDWDWKSSEPIAKDAPKYPPPDDYWIEARGYTIATDGYMIITKDCPIDLRASDRA